MTVDEAARDGLRRRLDEVLGPEHATTLMAHLPQIDSLATRDDVRALGDRVDHLRELMEQRFEAVDQRFEAVEQRFQLHQQAMDQRFEQQLEVMDQRFEHLLERMADRDQMVDERLSGVHTEIKAARNEVIASARGDLVTQTRVMFFTMAGSVAALGGLALGLARLV